MIACSAVACILGADGSKLASLVRSSCSQRGVSLRESSKADEAVQRPIVAADQSGNRPNVGPQSSSSGGRSKQLTPGISLEGNLKCSRWGMSGSSIILCNAPASIVSATPARSQIKTCGSEGCVQLEERGVEGGGWKRCDSRGLGYCLRMRRRGLEWKPSSKTFVVP
jgi:hypothetical protein